jgi:hypothetical protein
MQLPALLIMVIVGVVRVSPLVGRLIPATFHPTIVTSVGAPSSHPPRHNQGRERPQLFRNAAGVWRAPDIEGQLARRWG